MNKGQVCPNILFEPDFAVSNQQSAVSSQQSAVSGQYSMKTFLGSLLTVYTTPRKAASRYLKEFEEIGIVESQKVGCVTTGFLFFQLWFFCCWGVAHCNQ